MTNLQEGKSVIADYVSQTMRNRLVFCREPIPDLVFIDVGRCLAESLSHEDLRSPMVAYAAEDYLSEFLANIQSDASIGKYLALTNIGILFEPDLGLNVRNIFERESIGKTLIVCSPGELSCNRFYFTSEDDGVYVDLHDLPYRIL